MPLVRDKFLESTNMTKFVVSDVKADNAEGNSLEKIAQHTKNITDTQRKIIMRDIFITTQPSLLNNWLAAFPEAQLTAEFDETSLKAIDPKAMSNDVENATIFWLHMNMDRQQWLANTIASIKKYNLNAKIVVLANAPEHAESLHALSLGAMGYCHAYIAPAVLKEVKTVITNGGLWLGQELLQRLIEVSTKLVGNQPDYVESQLLKLTKREKEVAVEAAKGLSNKEIARILSITDRTVKAHLAAIFERLGAKDRLQLALMLNSNYRR